MYTPEQREKAVSLFIETGHSHSAVRARLGYPSSTTLDRWHDDHLRRGGLEGKACGYGRYSPEERATAVEACVGNGGNVSLTVRQLGYPSRRTLAEWMDDAAPGLRKRDSPHVTRDEEEQVEAILSVYSGEGGTAAGAAREAGVSRGTFYNWRRRLLGKDAKKVVDELKSTELPDDADELRKAIEAQRDELRSLQLEVAIWKAAAELVKKDPSADPNNLTNREKTILIGALRDRFELRELLEALDLAKSSYFYQVRAMESPDKYADLRESVAKIFRESKATWG